MHYGAGDDGAVRRRQLRGAARDDLLESELFGHERGAFTGAKQRPARPVEAAHGGTLFLDEIGELPLALQAKLLRFLETGRFRAAGRQRAEQQSTRASSPPPTATSRRRCAEGRFREDLYFRLQRLHDPTCRRCATRREDILPLAERFLRDARRPELRSRRRVRLGERARRGSTRYALPGQRPRAAQRARARAGAGAGPELTLGLLQTMREPVEGSAPAGSFVVTGDPRPLEEIEKRYVRHVLGQLGGRRVEAARVLGLSYPTFLKRLED